MSDPRRLDQRRAEAALLESEERFRILFEESLTGDLVATADGEILDCNPAFAEIFGFPSPAAAKATPLQQLLPDAEERSALFGGLLREGRLDRVDIHGRKVDGTPLHLVARMVASFDAHGRLTQIRAYLLDDTERRRTEEQLRKAQKMEAVGQLAGGIAHDFNNLLTAISGYTELALGQIEEANPAIADLEQVKRSTERAAELTRQLLAFSRRQVLRPRTLDLNQVVQEMHGMLRRLIRENIEITTQFAPELPPVKADPGQLQQVLVNLVVNAQDEMPSGGALFIETSKLEANGRTDGETLVRLTVRDTGGGIAPEIVDRIFEPFFTTKPVGQGTGLGLSTVYGIVTQSGGRILVDNEPGTGASFHVDLPAVRTPEERR